MGHVEHNASTPLRQAPASVQTSVRMAAAAPMGENCPRHSAAHVAGDTVDVTKWCECEWSPVQHVERKVPTCAQAATLTAAQVRPCTPVRQRAMLVELSTARATGRVGPLLSQRVRALCGARGFGPIFLCARTYVCCCASVFSTKRTFDPWLCSIIHQLLYAQKPAS
jgi:hypothetical protein